MAFEPKVFRNIKDGVGAPGDDPALNSTDDNTMVSLLKGMFGSLISGIAVTATQTDDAAFTVGTSKTQPVAGAYKAVRDSVDDGDAGTLAMSATRALYVTPESPAGDSLVDDTNDRLNVGLIDAQDGIDGAAGAATAKTVRTVTASDSPEIALITALSTEATAAAILAKLTADPATQTTLAAILAKIPATMGQKVMTESLAVTMASDQTAIPTSLSAASNASTTAYAASLVIKASAGTLYGLSGYNSKTSTQFIQLHDAASLPADTAVPKVVISVPASSAFAIDFGQRGRAFATGIVICNSSTGPTKTIGAADIWADTQFA